MSFTDFLEGKIIDHLFRNQAYAPPAAIYASAHSAEPGDTGANEAAGGGYARQVLTLSAGNPTDNDAAINWTMPAGTWTWWTIWDAAAAGNPMWSGPFMPAGAVRKAFVANDVTNNFLRCPAHGLVDNDRVLVSAEEVGVLPTGLSVTTVYYVVSAAADEFKVSLTQGGAAVDITAQGHGVLRQVSPKTTGAGDTLQIPAGDLDLEVV